MQAVGAHPGAHAMGSMAKMKAASSTNNQHSVKFAGQKPQAHALNGGSGNRALGQHLDVKG